MAMLKKIWNDPVWSKVIAGGILALMGFIFSKYSQIISDGLTQNKGNNILSNTPAIIILLFLFSCLLLITFTGGVLNNFRQIDNIIRNIHKEKNSNYWFLFWFIINHTLSSERLLQSQSFNHIPEMNKLYSRNIIKDSFASLTQFTINIDKRVYDYLDKKYHKLSNKNQNLINYINQITGKKFQEII